MIGSNLLWTAKEAEAATNGELRGGSEWGAVSVSIDSRTIGEDALFIALGGPYHDGHDYVLKAFEKGASAALVSHIKEDWPADLPLLLVKDTRKAMEALGIAARARNGGSIVAVTGSVGKTGTKNMLAAAFGAQAQTHASKASHNNHWGVPLTLAGLHAGDDVGIFEMGMNHAAEITPLSKMARPQISIITTIAPAHIENFADLQGIADAKAEIFDGMEAGGKAILNADNEFFGYLSDKAKAKGLEVYGFGMSNQAHAQILECLEAANGTRVKAVIAGQDYAFTLPMPGKHHVMNAMAVLLAVHLSGYDVQKGMTALERFVPEAGRGQQEKIYIGDPDNPITLIDESYNASPDSMRAAFRVVALIDPGRGGRRIAVLGDMLELGKQSSRYHADLALPLKAAGIDLVYTSGAMMKHLHDTLPANQRGAHRDTAQELAEIVPDALVPGDVVMVKGSNASKMGVVVEALRAMPGQKNLKDKAM